MRVYLLTTFDRNEIGADAVTSCDAFSTLHAALDGLDTVCDGILSPAALDDAKALLTENGLWCDGSNLVVTIASLVVNER